MRKNKAKSHLIIVPSRLNASPVPTHLPVDSDDPGLPLCQSRRGLALVFLVSTRRQLCVQLHQHRVQTVRCWFTSNSGESVPKGFPFYEALRSEAMRPPRYTRNKGKQPRQGGPPLRAKGDDSPRRLCRVPVQAFCHCEYRPDRAGTTAI